MAKERVFLGVPIPEETQKEIKQFLRGYHPLPGKVSPHPNWHMTLFFFGGMEELKKIEICKAIDGANFGNAFEIEFGSFLAFPHPEKTRVLSLGLNKGEDDLSYLAEALARIAQVHGFEGEDRAYQAHLTLARFGKKQKNMVHFIKEAQSANISMKVQRFVLYRSTPTPTGSTYDELQSWVIS